MVQAGELNEENDEERWKEKEINLKEKGSG